MVRDSYLPKKSKAREVVQQFISCINNHNVEGITELLTSNHQFTDGLGTVFKGKVTLREGWTQYFKTFPDYHMEIEKILDQANVVGIFGHAVGTYSNPSSKSPRTNRNKMKKSWKIPAAWRAVVQDGLVSEWQVYTDNEPVWKAMGVKRY